jgi:hypothetical protein
MRKHAMILALVLALTMGLVFIGCGGPTDNGDVSDADNVRFFKIEPPTLFKIEVGKNQYSDGKDDSKGNQYKLSFDGMKDAVGIDLALPDVGDKYAVEISFVADETVVVDAKRGAVSLALVDDNPNSNGPSTYWYEWGEWSDCTGATVGGDTGKTKAFAQIPKAEAGTTVDFKGTITIRAKSSVEGAASATATGNICLVFAMESQPWGKPVVLYITKFEFEKI